MTENIEARVIEIVESVLKQQSADVHVDGETSMESAPECDSLNFIHVFMAVNQGFDINPDPDDAIHYRSVPGIVEFVSAELART